MKIRHNVIISNLLTLLLMSMTSSDVIDRESHLVRETENLKLQHLHVLFRHGDRTPFANHFHPSEPFEKFWPAGRGQLTDKGIHQEFQLGQWLRQEYDSYIPKIYNASDFHMRSTDIDRTLMSAQSVIAGIYQNASSPLEKEGIKWRPVPVHTVKHSQDVLLSAASCPCLTHLRRLQMNSPDSIEFEENHKPLFDLLSKNLGKKINRFDMISVLDTLICMRSTGVAIPEWVTDKVYVQIQEVATYYWNLNYAASVDTLRLEIGVFLNTFIDQTRAVVGATTSSVLSKYHLSVQHTMAYSSHDTDVTYLLAAFGSFDWQMIEYSGAVVLELRGPDPPKPTSEYFVFLRYKRGYPDLEGEYRNMSACPNRSGKDGCPLDRVIAYLEPFLLTTTDFYSVCSVVKTSREYKGPAVKYIDECRSPQGNDHVVIYAVVGVLVVICVVAVSAAFGFWWWKRRQPYTSFNA